MVALYDEDRLLKRLLRVEGSNRRMYRDSKGIWTIGIGHNLEARGISVAAEAQILRDDLADVVRQLDSHAPWWRKLDQVRREVIIELCFNMGWGDGKHGLSSFTNTLQAIASERWADAARGLRHSKWARDVKAYRAETLIQALETGEWGSA